MFSGDSPGGSSRVTKVRRKSTESSSDVVVWLGDPEAISSVRRACKSVDRRRVDQVHSCLVS